VARREARFHIKPLASDRLDNAWLKRRTVSRLAIAALVYVLIGRHVLFLPLILLFPLGIFVGRRRRD